MTRKATLILTLILASGLAWAKPQLGTDGNPNYAKASSDKPLPPHLRHKGPQAQKQQPVNLKQHPGRPQMPGRPGISKQPKSKPVQAGKAMPRPGIKGLVKDDFLINDDILSIGQYAGYQYEPKAALLPGGEMMVVWYDERNSWNYQIFGRCYDAAGNPVGDDFLINDFTGAGAEYPAVTASGNGFIVAWTDYRNNFDDIYAQRFGPAGTPIGVNFMVNDFYGECYYPSLAANDSGFVITWEDYRSGSYYDIYAQRYDASGSAVGGNFMVNDDGGSSDHYQYGGYNISGSDSGFVITWYDYRSDSDWDIYAQRLDAAGDTLGGNFLVNDDGGGDDQYDPSVASTDSGFVITWYDYRNGDWDIYAQRFNAAGDTLGGNFLVSDDGGGYDQYDPIVAASDSGFVVTWYDYRSGSYWDIYAQQYDASGAALGGNFLVNDDGAGTCDHYSPSLAANNSGFVVSWYDDRHNTNGYYDIFCQRYDLAGDTLGPNFMVNSGDTGTADQWDASVAMDKFGRSLAVWYDLRHDDGSWNLVDQYGQLYDADGKPVGANFIINDTLSAAHRYGYDPRAAFLPGGGFVVTWYNYDFSWNGNIYAQLFDSAGTPVGGNFVVRDVAASSGYCSDVAATDSGFVITWYDFRNGNSDIYAQLYKTNGDTIGGNFLVDDGANYQYSPMVASCSSSFVIAWYDYRNGNWDVYAQRYNAAGDTLGGNFIVSDDGGGYDQYDVSVAARDSGFVIAWYDYRSGSDWDIYAQIYKANGDTIGGNFLVNDDASGNEQYYPSVALSPDGHNLVIAWEDYRNDPNGNLAEIMAQKYVDGVAVGGNLVVNGTTLANRYFWGGKRIACTDQRILFSWDDNRRFKGGDIYAKLTDWDLAHIEGEVPVISHVDSLGDDAAAPYGPYTIKAVVSDNQLLSQVKLLYQINGGTADTLEMSFTAADTFEIAIPAQVLGAYDTVSIDYWIEARDSSGNKAASNVYGFKALELTGVAGQPTAAIPGAFALQNAYPNPSRGQTTFKYQLPKESRVSLTVYNVVGQAVKRFDIGAKPAGYHQVNWNDNLLPNGIYFYRLQAGGFSATRKLVVLR